MSTSSATKGFNGYMKAIVVAVDRNACKVQVCIPSIHGKLPDNINGNLNKYPWASVKVLNFLDKSNKGFLSSIFGNGNNRLPISLPNIHDIVWVSFEGGDIRNPIFMGSVGKTSKKKSDAISNDESSWDKIFDIFNQSIKERATSVLSEKVSNMNFSYGGGISSNVESITGENGDVITTSKLASPIAKDIVNYAQSFIGKLVYTMSTSGSPNRYDINNKSINSGGSIGADCSSYMSHIFKHFGYNIGGNTAAQQNAGKLVPNRSDMLPADIIVCGPASGIATGGSSHVVMCINETTAIHMDTKGCGTISIDFCYKNWGKQIIRRIV